MRKPSVCICENKAADSVARFSLIQTIEGINVNIGLVRMCGTHSRFFWIIFPLDLELSYTKKVLVFQWVQTGLFL